MPEYVFLEITLAHVRRLGRYAIPQFGEIKIYSRGRQAYCEAGKVPGDGEGRKETATEGMGKDAGVVPAISGEKGNTERRDARTDGRSDR